MGIFLESIWNKCKLKCKLSHKDNHEIDSIMRHVFNKNKSISEIANSLNIDYWDVFESVENFRKAGLVKKVK